MLVLSRVQAFLPQLKNANEQLEKADPSKLDIENVDEEDGQYIEMVGGCIIKCLDSRLTRSLPRILGWVFIRKRSQDNRIAKMIWMRIVTRRN